MNFELLRALHGTWEGRGRGGYPTIESFEYTEATRFEYDERYPLVHFEQRTILTDGEPSHWESGFFRSTEGGLIDMTTAQNGTRVEVIRGPLTAFDDGFRLELESIAFGNDVRLVRTGRAIELRGDRLNYEVKMATTTTDAPQWLTHLTAELHRT